MEEMIVMQVKVLLERLDDTKSTFRKSGAKNHFRKSEAKNHFRKSGAIVSSIITKV